MKTAMIVDDEVVVVRAMKKRVNWEKFGISKVYEANSMKQAIEIFRKTEIDILFCDIEMPEGSGLELFEWVKEYFPYVECIYVTCHPDFEYIRKAMRLGSFDYLLKPIDYAELHEVLGKAVQRADANMLVKEHVHQRARKYFNDESGPTHSSSDVVEKIKEYVKEHIQEEISMGDIAEVVYLNPQYMVRLFKKKEGISILEYITNARVKMASDLLRETDYSIYQVASLVGYFNYSYFSRVFKKIIGKSPQEYKKGMR